MSTTPTKVMTGKVRISYAHLLEPAAIQEGQEKKYSASLIIPKTDTATLGKIKAAVAHLVEEVKAKNQGKIPKKFKLPLRDGDEDREDDPNYANSMFLNCSSKQKPGIVDMALSPIIDAEEIYSGMFGRVTINFYSFDKAGNVGIGCGLGNLQKICDGDRLSGGASAQADFGDAEALEDDLL